MANESLMIEKPTRFGKWLIWPHTVLDIIEITDCDDTINGICLSGKSIQECLDECSDGMGTCAAGYHVTFPDGHSVCVPIRTDLHPYLNPVYRLRKQSIYPELDNVEISTFVNTEIFPFPPKTANVVFFRDILELTTPNKKWKVGSPEIKGGELLYMSDTLSNNLQLIPAQVSAGQIAEYMPLLYGQPFQIAIPGTSLIARISPTYYPGIEWDSTTGTFHGDDLAFVFVPSVNGNKKTGDIVTYNDIFSLRYQESYVVLHKTYNYLMILHDDLGDIRQNDEYISEFSLTSKMMGYYCDNGQCKQIGIKDVRDFDVSGQFGYHNNSIVGRNKVCWGMCDTNFMRKKSLDAVLRSDGPSHSYKNHILLSMILFAVLIALIVYLNTLYN